MILPHEVDGLPVVVSASELRATVRELQEARLRVSELTSDSANHHMTLADLIAYLEKQPPGDVWGVGLTKPHSYRGWYERAAFVPTRSVTVEVILRDARGAVGVSVTGYKGGEYVLGAASLVHVAAYGCLGAPCTAELLETLREVR